jgi:enterochelin esterase-like enzyme
VGGEQAIDFGPNDVRAYGPLDIVDIAEKHLGGLPSYGGEMASVADWSLISLTARLLFTTSGATAGVVLIIRRDRRWWQRIVPAVLVAGAAVCMIFRWLIDYLQPFGDYSMPPEVLIWIGVAVSGIGFGFANLPGSTWRRRIVAATATAVVLASSAAEVNAFYGYVPNLRSAVGLRPANEIDFSAVPPPVPDTAPYDQQRLLSEQWAVPAGLPNHGVVTEVPIPSPVSGFRTTRDAVIYLPPSYMTAHRPLLPVLILFHSTPGRPRDWINAGELAVRVDGFAAARGGLAPVVVIPDTTGAWTANPMCVDSALGNSETYLTRDVPAWIRSHLQVNADPRLWAVGGYSSGGTCALQLALRHPDLFPTFIDIAGQVEPTLKNRRDTIDRAFGGDSAKFMRLTPLDMLARRKYPETAGRLYDGAHDPGSIAEQQTILAACRRNGIDVQLTVVPGSHTWYSWGRAFDLALPWLAARQGISRH